MRANAKSVEKIESRRDPVFGMSFPEERVEELKTAAKEMGVTLSSFIRIQVYRRLDEIRKAKAA